MQSRGDAWAFGRYRMELASCERLDAERERSLAQAWAGGDHDAGRRLVEGCLPFVVSIAVEYRRWGMPLEDLVQEGNIGLLKAAARFDPSRGCRLATYAAYWIRAEIREAVMRSYRMVRVGTSKSERRAIRMHRTGEIREAQSLSESSGLSLGRAEALLPLLARPDVALDQNPGDGPSDRLAGDGPSPEEIVGDAEERAAHRDALRRALTKLDARDKAIVRARWLSEAPMTLEQLGKRFGISKERVRQLEERAKRTLREAMGAELSTGDGRTADAAA